MYINKVLIVWLIIQFSIRTFFNDLQLCVSSQFDLHKMCQRLLCTKFYYVFYSLWKINYCNGKQDHKNSLLQFEFQLSIRIQKFPRRLFVTSASLRPMHSLRTRRLLHSRSRVEGLIIYAIELLNSRQSRCRWFVGSAGRSSGGLLPVPEKSIIIIIISLSGK